jgi:mannose-6-phosphate isomerase-like protein (cupin superfamily)
MSKLKYNIRNIGGEVVKDNETYLLRDNKFLKNLVVSSTFLKPNQSTRGHSHAGQEEVYYFVDGTGRMELDGEVFDVRDGDVVLIPDGVFHRVFNPTDRPLYFVCVFDGKRNH